MIDVNKKSIVFMPGWGFKSSIWDDILASLNMHTVRRLDLPNIKETNDLPIAIKRLSKHIPLNSTIVAWSLSGLIAILFCHHFPHRCNQLILVASLPKFVSDSNWIGIPSTVAKQFQHKAMTDPGLLLKQFLDWVQYPDTSKSVRLEIKNHCLTPHAKLIQYLTYMFNEDLRDIFNYLQTRIYLVFGEKDAIVPSQAVNQLNKLNKKLLIKIVPEAGHIPFLTHKELFTQILMDILYE